ncbi:hypothetical protein GALL_90550 [mine drainage metagenome]|uniref:DUF3108 domain-containing protein n=1 Tax=mine drainage metagenome TaxID=410659 RepID=A0A1J5SX95_9ZZZZ
MSFRLDTVSRRVAFAVVVSLLLHSLVLWGPNIRLPDFSPALPQLTARLEALPSAPARSKPKRKTRPAAKQIEPAPAPEPKPETLPQAIIPAASTPVAASEPAVASAPVETGTLATDAEKPTDRPPLPMHARLTFAINKGTSSFRIGEAIHTLDIDDGRYVLQATTSTVGIARLFKSYELDQYSSGRYGKGGLQPELFAEERKERLGKQRNAVEFDHTGQRAHFSNGKDVVLPPETQDILSVMYQFPPLAHTEVAAVSVCNGKKIEHYQFGVTVDETIDTPLGKLLTVHLHKMHAANEEGLDIWLAREYRLFPVKLRFTEKNGEVSGEAVITDIRVSEEEGVRKDVVN